MEQSFTLSTVSELVGATPPRLAVPVSLAVKRYVERYKPSSIVVGVSGGADSLALTVAAADLANRRNIPLKALTVDHQMREESTQEANRVAGFLASLEIDASVVTVDVRASGGPEGSARDARFAALQALAAPGSDILLGHTMNDQAETVLLRLGRGSSLLALSAMSPRRQVDNTTLHIGRPLLDVRRRDTEAFCTVLGLNPVFDPTNSADGPWRNASGDPLPRAAIRERVLPALNAALGQDTVASLARVASAAAEDDAALQNYALRAIQESKVESGYRVESLAAEPRAVRLRVARNLVDAQGARNITRAALESVDALLVDWHGQGSVMFGGGVGVKREGRCLCVFRIAS